MQDYGIQGQLAPELRVPDWIEGATSDRGLLIADIDEPLIYLYAFQSWCPGCHSHGFPTLRMVQDGLEQRGFQDQVRFIAVQTVFEGHETNTRDSARESLLRHGLEGIALGHDSGHPPTLMQDYRTGGTPWTIVIGPDRRVLANGFQVDAANALAAFTEILEAPPQP